MMEKWIKELTADELPEEYKELASIIGIENLMKLTQRYGGAALYIPKYDSVTKTIRNKRIKEEFNGGNYKELALKYNLCETWIRNIINSKELDGQLSLFG
mgnify:CR=1 FL=1